MNVFIGSRNQVKIDAVRFGFTEFIDGADDWDYIGVDVDSKVSAQPYGDEESISGAFNRSKEAEYFKKTKNDYFIGIEAGIIDRDEWMEVFDWVVIRHKGKIGISCSGRFVLPNDIADLVRKGFELSDAADRIWGTSRIGHNIGAVGYLSKGKITRTDYLVHAVLLALSGLYIYSQ